MILQRISGGVASDPIPGRVMAIDPIGDRLFVCSTDGPYWVDGDGHVYKVCPGKDGDKWMAGFLRSLFGSLALFSVLVLSIVFLNGCQTTEPGDVRFDPIQGPIVQADTLPDAAEHEAKEITATPFRLGDEVSEPLGCRLNPEAC